MLTILRVTILVLCAAAAARGDETVVGPLGNKMDAVDALLLRSRMSHEPDAVIREAVALLDQRLDAQPRDKRSWLKLAEALAIGFATSRHADSPLAARRHATEIDPDDCHVAGLVARGEAASGKSPQVERWLGRPSPCAEILYVASILDRKKELELLARSRAVAPSAEALVAIGIAQLRNKQLAPAEEAYRAALAAPALFPEDWRVDGWTAVHANLGLAVVYARTKEAKKSRACRKALHEYLDDPGPWHDLSDEEKAWAKSALHETID